MPLRWLGAVAMSLALLSPAAWAGSYSVQTDVPYSDSGQLLDLYRPDQPPAQPLPAVVMIHGGGWNAGSKEEFTWLGPWFAEQGYVAVSINYRLATGSDNFWPVQSEDVRQAVWYLRHHAAEWGGDPSRILAIGFSAGGHLSAWLGTTEAHEPGTGLSSRVEAVISMAGPWSLLGPLPQGDDRDYPRWCIATLLGSLNIAPRERASPYRLIDGLTPRTLLLHGSADNVVPVEQARMANHALQQSGVPVTLEVIPGLGHSYPADLNQWYVPIRRFLDEWRAATQ